MTERKPANVSFPDFVEAQIREAERRGAFQNLPGAGKPIPGLDREPGELDWIVGKLRRENVDVAAVLPPALALAKEVEVLPERLARERSEARVREHLADLNRRITSAQLRPQTGPPMRVRTVNVEHAVEAWREARLAARPEPVAEVASPVERPAVRRRFFRRRRATT